MNNKENNYVMIEERGVKQTWSDSEDVNEMGMREQQQLVRGGQCSDIVLVKESRKNIRAVRGDQD